MIPVGTAIVSDDTHRLCLGAAALGALAFLYGLLLGASIKERI